MLPGAFSGTCWFCHGLRCLEMIQLAETLLLRYGRNSNRVIDTTKLYYISTVVLVYLEGAATPC